MNAIVRPFEIKEGEEIDPTASVNEALAALTASVEGRLKAIETKSADSAKLNDRLDKIEAKMQRPGAGEKIEDASLEVKSFNAFMRRGIERLQPDEVKSLTVAVDANGGYLAPEQFGSEILKALVEFSPIRRYARVVTIGGSEIKYPKRTGTTSAYWVDETADRTTSQPAYDQVSLKPFELATFTDISNQLLEDNTYNLESELTADFAESFGKTEGLAFVKGAGATQPMGLMNATGIAAITTGNAAAFPATNPADVIIGMYHSLPTAHAQKGVWIMNRNTLGTMRKWKDSTGRYLVIDPISEGMPATLLGRPIVEAIDMDDIAADAYPVIFGDLAGYRIVDRIGLSVLRDPYTLATKGQIRFHARRRVGADVTHPDRFVKLQVAV